MDKWIHGRHAVIEALKSRQECREIWLSRTADRERLKEILDLATRSGIPVKNVDLKKIDHAARGLTHQGILALVKEEEFNYKDLDDILKRAEAGGRRPVVAALDGITDPHNLGAIIRSAECAGFHGVIIPKHGSAEVNSTVIKTSAGAVWHIPIVQVTNLVQAIKELQSRGLWVYGTDGQSDRTIYDMDTTDGIVIVIGSEGSGMRRLVKQHCDFLVKIPQYGEISSLNASVSAGIVFFEVVRQRTLLNSEE